MNLRNWRHRAGNNKSLPDAAERVLLYKEIINDINSLFKQNRQRADGKTGGVHVRKEKKIETTKQKIKVCRTPALAAAGMHYDAAAGMGDRRE